MSYDRPSETLNKGHMDHLKFLRRSSSYYKLGFTYKLGFAYKLGLLQTSAEFQPGRRVSARTEFQSRQSSNRGAVPARVQFQSEQGSYTFPAIFKLALFASTMPNTEICLKRGTHHGVTNDIVACIATTRSSTSSVFLQYPTPLLYSTMEQ